MCPLFRGLTLRSYRKDEPLSSDTFWGKPFSHPIDEVGISNLEVTFGNVRVVDRFSLDSQEEANEIEVVFCGKSPLSKYINNMTMIFTLSNCTSKEESSQIKQMISVSRSQKEPFLLERESLLMWEWLS